MIWSLIVSCYVIYLYRKLNAEETTDTAASDGSGMSAVETELAKLNERIGALESRLTAAKSQGPAS